MKRKIANLTASCLLAVALLLAMIPPLPVGATPPDRSDKIEQVLLDNVRANMGGRFDVIVAMERGKGGESRGALEKAGGKHGRELPIIGGSSGSLPGQGILALAQNPDVARVYEDSQLTPLGTNVTTVSTQAVRAPETWALGYTGKGIGVAVLDSGVAAHPDLVSPTNRIVASIDVNSGPVAPSDMGGHGTHVAGIIAGNGSASGGARQGIAPGANIISVKVTTDTGFATYSSVIAGVQWVLKNRRTYNIRVMNLSLGAPVKASYKDDPLDSALEVAWFSGIVVTVAAGNGGPGASTITAPGNDPYVITVGAFDDNGTKQHADDRVPDFSSRGPTAIDNLPKPDLSAPGRRIVSLRVQGSYLDQLYPDRVVDNQYFRLTGTSMAAPVVAGVVALLLEKDPRLSPNQVKNVLARTTKEIKCDANACGAGAVDALDAVKYKGREIGNNGLRPGNLFASSVYAVVKGAPLVWRDPKYMGRNWANYTWDTLPWDNYTWDNFSWESWANYTWDNYTWDNYTWDNYTWDNYTWDNYTWDNYTWDNYTWDNYTWD